MPDLMGYARSIVRRALWVFEQDMGEVLLDVGKLLPDIGHLAHLLLNSRSWVGVS